MNIAKWPTMAKKKGHGRHSRTPHIAAKGRSAPVVPAQPLTHSIIISEEPFGAGFDVQLSHPVDGNAHGGEFHGYPNALAYARVLRLEFGFPIVDRSGVQS